MVKEVVKISVSVAVVVDDVGTFDEVAVVGTAIGICVGVAVVGTFVGTLDVVAAVLELCWCGSRRHRSSDSVVGHRCRDISCSRCGWKICWEHSW